MKGLQLAIRRCKRRGIPGVRRLGRLLESAGIRTLAASKARGCWIYWLPATVHGVPCFLVVAHRCRGWIHCFLDNTEGNPAHSAGPVEVFMSLRGEIRVHKLDTLGYVLEGNPERGNYLPADDITVWLPLIKETPTYTEDLCQRQL